MVDNDPNELAWGTVRKCNRMAYDINVAPIKKIKERRPYINLDFLKKSKQGTGGVTRVNLRTRRLHALVRE